MTIDEKIAEYLERAKVLVYEGDIEQNLPTSGDLLKLQSNVIEVAAMIQKEEHRIKEHKHE